MQKLDFLGVNICGGEIIEHDDKAGYKVQKSKAGMQDLCYHMADKLSDVIESI